NQNRNVCLSHWSIPCLRSPSASALITVARADTSLAVRMGTRDGRRLNGGDDERQASRRRARWCRRSSTTRTCTSRAAWDAKSSTSAFLRNLRAVAEGGNRLIQLAD